MGLAPQMSPKGRAQIYDVFSNLPQLPQNAHLGPNRGAGHSASRIRHLSITPPRWSCGCQHEVVSCFPPGAPGVGDMVAAGYAERRELRTAAGHDLHRRVSDVAL